MAGKRMRCAARAGHGRPCSNAGGRAFGEADEHRCFAALQPSKLQALAQQGGSRYPLGKWGQAISMSGGLAMPAVVWATLCDVCSSMMPSPLVSRLITVETSCPCVS